MAEPRVYADLVFLANALLDAWVLLLAARTSGGRVAPARLALAASVGGLYGVAVFWPPLLFLSGLGGKILGSALLVAIAYGSPSLRDLGRKAIFFYSCAFGVAGCTYGLEGLLSSSAEGLGLRLAIVVAAPLEWFLAGQVGKLVARRQAERGIVPLGLGVGEREVCLPALVDTGNLARDPLTHAQVIFVEANVLAPLLPPEVQFVLRGDPATLFDRLALDFDPDWARRLRIVPVHSLGAGTVLTPAFRPDNIRAGGRKVPALSALVGIVARTLSADGSYHALVPADMLQSEIARKETGELAPAHITEGGAS